MKKLILSLLLVLGFCGCAFGFEEVFVEEKPPVIEQDNTENIVQPDVTFDWFDITVDERQQQAQKYKDIIFVEDSKIYMSKTDFRKAFAKYKKDKEYKHHYMLTNNGVRDDEDAKYNPFYYRKGTLIIYAIQYKNDFHNSLYYTPYGKLYYVDITSDNYPNFPYYSMQYDRKGNLKSAIYFLSKDIQYMYNNEKEFIGIWYKDKMYNLEGKQISTREGW